MINVVSFFAPRTEHPLYQDYTPYLNLLRESCEKYGHRHLVLTDDASLGVDAYVVPDLPRSLMKAVTAAQAAYLADPEFSHTPTLLVGADCVLARDPAEVFEGADFDLGITVCDEFLDCRMNTGAIFVPRPCLVSEIWEEALAHVGDDWGDDQTSLYRAICERPTHGVFSPVVREFPVDPYNLAPVHPHDDCTRGMVLHFRGRRKAWMTDYCKNWLDIGEGVQVSIKSNTTAVDMFRNVRANMGRNVLTIEARPAHQWHAVLVGGGPSLADSLPEIMRRQLDNQRIFALNGAGKWLVEQGINPDYVVILDPRESNASFVGPNAIYLLASQCHPAVFDAAASFPKMMWHFAEPGVHEIVRDGTLIGGGLTVGLTAMGLVHTMGYRVMHLYGYDSSDADGEAHAYEQSESRAEGMRYEVWCAGRRFLCQPAMYAQAKEFPEWAVKLANEGSLITVHGDGLLPTVARHMMAASPINEELAA